ncbi:replication protein A 70 kDa DNA-binding subunit C-like protein [Tanacetum coccineum]
MPRLQPSRRYPILNECINAQRKSLGPQTSYKDEFRIFRDDKFMIEFDGETTARKVSADPHGFCRYPFRLIEFDQVEAAKNKYLIDIVGYVTNVGRTSYTRKGSKTLEFYLANQRGQSLRVTLWGELGDVLVEKKTKHAGEMGAIMVRLILGTDEARYKVDKDAILRDVVQRVLKRPTLEKVDKDQKDGVVALELENIAGIQALLRAKWMLI